MIRFHEEGAIEERSMKLAYCNPVVKTPARKPLDWTDVHRLFDQCHDALQHQPAGVARRMKRLFLAFAGVLEHESDDVFRQARQLEEMVAFLVAARPRHEETRHLQRQLTRLLHAAFGTPEWRRPFIQGL
jgi:hypothetical protein